jgi:hypothetical protein
VVEMCSVSASASRGLDIAVVDVVGRREEMGRPGLAELTLTRNFGLILDFLVAVELTS